MLLIYGTITSPYVRRVRVVAHELGLEHELIDTTTDTGQAELRRRSPIWKVPAAELDGQLVFDSRVICDLLVARHGAGKLARVEQTGERNLITVIDGALDSLVNCFYLARDGVDTESVAYLRKQQERAASALAWIDAQVNDGRLGPAIPTEALDGPMGLDLGFGLPEIALATAAAWMRFRATYPIERHPGVVACLQRCEARPSFAATQPSAQVVTK
jgi:glutathione S-transferase